MKEYLDILKHVVENGEKREDRTGTGTLSCFGLQARYDLNKGFPATTTKKLAWKSMVSELLWFIEGSDDERRLSEITHGSRDDSKKTIWTENAEADYWKPKSKFHGDLGRVYGVQWRKWRKFNVLKHYGEGRVAADMTEVDQLSNLIHGIKTDPHSRRHLLTAWNVAELDQMALPPCHTFSQFYVSSDNKLSCHLYTRSQDLPLGTPFNIASYSLLTHMIAQVCDLGVGELVHTMGDAHIYLNQVATVKEQLQREPLPLPKLWLNPNIKDIEKFTMDDIKLLDYNYHPPLNYPFSV